MISPFPAWARGGQAPLRVQAVIPATGQDHIQQVHLGVHSCHVELTASGARRDSARPRLRGNARVSYLSSERDYGPLQGADRDSAPGRPSPQRVTAPRCHGRAAAAWRSRSPPPTWSRRPPRPSHRSRHRCEIDSGDPQPSRSAASPESASETRRMAARQARAVAGTSPMRRVEEWPPPGPHAIPVTA